MPPSTLPAAASARTLLTHLAALLGVLDPVVAVLKQTSIAEVVSEAAYTLLLIGCNVLETGDQG